MKRIVYILFIFLFGKVNLSAQSAFTATVSKNPVSVGEQFQVTFTLNTNGSGFQAPTFSDFNVLGGPSTSTSMQFINGSMSQSISYTYVLQARSEGNFKIGSASVTAEGKRLQTNPITLAVVKGTPQQQQQQKQGQQRQQQGGNIETVTGNNIMIKVSVDKTTVYRGEAIVATFKLYTNVNIVNYGLNKMPAFSGFWSQEIQMPQELQLHTENVNGINYRVGEIKKVVLFPQQSGSLTVEPMEGEFIARVAVKRQQQYDPFGVFNDPFFNDPFFGTGAKDVKVLAKSDPLKITVKELPSGAPESFNGAVGKMNFEATLDKNEAKTNDPLTLKIKVSGKGNLKLIDAPTLKIPPGIESYDPTVDDNLSVTTNGVNGSRIYKYTLIPRTEGNYQLEPVSFTYFDLDKKQYVTTQSPSFQIRVQKGSGESSAMMNTASKSDFQLLGSDIRYIKTGPVKFISTSDIFYGSMLFYLLLALPFFILALAIAYRKYRDKVLGDSAGLRSRKATGMAKKRLAVAKKFLQQKNNNQFYEEVFKSLYGYLGDKLNISPSDLSKDSAGNALRERNVKEETIQKLISTLDYTEFARFAPSAGISNESVYNDALQIITQLEDEIS